MSKEYFPHDYGARLSLRAIRKDFGLEGVGFYWCFVEMLHEEGGYIKENDIENIAYDLQTKTELAEAIIRNYDLFTIKKGKIYSERVLKNIKKRAEISAARKNAAESRWKSGDSDGEQTPPPNKPAQKPIEEQFEDRQQWESFEAAVKWYREIIELNYFSIPLYGCLKAFPLLPVLKLFLDRFLCRFIWWWSLLSVRISTFPPRLCCIFSSC